MNPAERAARLMKLFQEAVEIEPGRRPAWLRDVCADDTELQRELEGMLTADTADCAWLDDDSIVSAGAAHRAAEVLGREDETPKTEGTMIGGFRLGRELGRGGMGTVYEAWQDHPHRRVALKLMQAGILGDDARRRFEREVDLLGRLSHPGIARVFEAGVHGDGAMAAPYFAMEFVENARTINEYGRDLAVRDRVELMAMVCDAVHHAHEEGVIHRDLKPANILVGTDGAPRLIDFGIARALEPAEDGANVQTMTGQLMGTLAWMSPEQLAGDPSLVTRRTDVFALGVTLYELLTGARPVDFDGRSMPEAVDLARQAEPVPLVRRDPKLRGDLETIVERAMAREPERRYPSAGALANDLRRHLRGDPITARADSTLYVMQRKILRYRRALIIAVAFFVLITGAAFVTWRLDHERRALQAQVTLLVRDAPTDVAPERLISDVVRIISDTETMTDPFAAEAPDETQLETLARWLETNALDPDVEGRLRTALGYAWNRLEDPDTAVLFLERGLALRLADGGEAEIAVAELGLARARTNRFELKEGERLYRSSLARRRALTNDPDDLPVAESLNGLAGCMKRQGRFAEAREIYRESLGMRERARPTQSHLIAASQNNLGDCLEKEGRFEEAIPLYASALEMIAAQRINIGYRLRAERNVALCRLAAGQREGAIESLRRIAAATVDEFGENHLDALAARHDLAQGYLLIGDPTQASIELERVVRRWRPGAYPPAARPLAASVHSLRARIALDMLDEPESAEVSIEAAETALGQVLPDHHPQIRGIQLLRARIDALRGDDERARREMKSALRVLAGVVAPSHPHRQYGELHLSRLLEPKEVEARLHRFRLEASGAWLDPRLRFEEAIAALQLRQPASDVIAQATLERLEAWYGVDHEETNAARNKLRLLQAPQAYP